MGLSRQVFWLGKNYLENSINFRFFGAEGNQKLWWGQLSRSLGETRGKMVERNGSRLNLNVSWGMSSVLKQVSKGFLVSQFHDGEGRISGE